MSMMMMRMAMTGAIALACVMPAMAERRQPPRNVKVDGELACERRVADLAKQDYRWLSSRRWAAQMLGEGSTTTWVMMGDQIEFQATNGSWFRVTYMCKWDQTDNSAKAGIYKLGRI